MASEPPRPPHHHVHGADRGARGDLESARAMKKADQGQRSCRIAQKGWTHDCPGLRQSEPGSFQPRLMPHTYVKAYVKRNKHDVADVEAICEAVRRPSMRFVPSEIKGLVTATNHSTQHGVRPVIG